MPSKYQIAKNMVIEVSQTFNYVGIIKEQRTKMSEQFNGKVALVTGASSGIGRAAALAFGTAGAKVVVAARRENEGCAVAAEIEKNGGNAIFVKADVTVESDVQNLLKRVQQAYGRLDFAFNNAGSSKPGKLTEYTEQDWEKEIAINLKSVWLSLKYEMPLIGQSGGGGIVNMSSQGGLLGIANYGVYGAAKGGVIALTRAAAAEGATQRIRVNSVAPRAVKTDLWNNAPAGMLEQVAAGIPLKRVGDPEDIAQVVLFLCSPAAAFITGQNIPIDGGFTTVQPSQ